MSRALVLKTGRALAPLRYARYRYNRYIRMARMASYVARGVYRNRKGIGRAMKGLKRRKRVLSSPSTANGNQAWYDLTGAPSASGRNTSIVLQRRTMWSAPVEIAKPPSSTELLGQPSRNAVRLSGLKICIHAHNGSNSATDVTMMHIALVQSKTFGTTAWDPSDFFSMPGGGNSGTDRTQNWTDFAVQPAANFDYNCLGINKDKWQIITHVKRVVQPTNQGTVGGSNTVKYERYIPMKGARVMWDTISANNISRPLFLLVWHERTANDNVTGVPDFKFNVNTVSYFRNT
jgi:hypothetical protein